MKIEELREKAEIKEAGCFVGDLGICVAEKTSQIGKNTEMIALITTLDQAEPKDTARAFLIAHCLNTHPMVLDALKEITKSAQEIGMNEKACLVLHSAKQAIKAAEEVQDA